MFIIKRFKTCLTYKLLRERESNEQRAEAGERAMAGEWERERRPTSGRGSDGWRAGERVAAGKRKRE
jgi:hypothetical protein